jgi:hypothetical protein
MELFDRLLLVLKGNRPTPYPELKKLLSGYNSRRKAPEILYLGDSVLERISWNDKDKRTLPVMVADRLRSRKFMMYISHSAYHLKVYYYLLRVLEFTRQKPKLVILPINIRSFSPQWDLNPNWQFNDEIEALKGFAASPVHIPPLPQKRDTVLFTEQEKRKELSFPFTSLRCLGEFQEIIQSDPVTDEEKFFRKKQIFIFHYLHPLSESHPKLDFLPQIVKFCRSLGVGLLIYMTPVNYEGGVRYIGKDFTRLLGANVNTISKILDPFLADSVRFLDLSQTCSSEYFFHADEASEHLNQYGRARLADILANEVACVSKGNELQGGFPDER